MEILVLKATSINYMKWVVKIWSQVEMDHYEAPPAHYFGVPAIGVRDEAGLKEELEKALKADGPTVIEAVVDASHYLETVFD